MINADILGNQVKRKPDNRRRQYAENIGNDNEKDAGDQMPAVFPQIFIEISQVFHAVRQS